MAFKTLFVYLITGMIALFVKYGDFQWEPAMHLLSHPNRPQASVHFLVKFKTGNPTESTQCRQIIRNESHMTNAYYMV